MNILITGGNGYIARNIFSSLSIKYNVIKITRNDFDLTDSAATSSWFCDKTFDVVIHTAVVGGSRLQSDPIDTLPQNLKMIHNLQMNKCSFGKLITFGSGAEIFNPHTPYGMSKKAIADVVENNVNWYNLRIFGVFNEDELFTRFIKGNLIRYLNKESMVIHSNKIMDFFYMKDLVGLVEHYITNTNLPKAANCSYEKKYTLMGIADGIINALDTYTVPVVVENNKELEFYCGNSHGCPIKEIGLYGGIIDTFRVLKNV